MLSFAGFLKMKVGDDTISKSNSGNTLYWMTVACSAGLAVGWLSSRWRERRRSRRIHSKERAQTEHELALAYNTVRNLERKLMMLEATDLEDETAPGEEIRVFMDGAFDLMHYGHMNAFRLGRSLGTHLIVGVNDGDSITQHKGCAPVLTDAERLTIVEGCRWVDEVVRSVPYVMNDDYLDFLFQTYKVDYVVHGDDPCIVDGRDVYSSARRRGKYLEIPRTEGISTTDLVGRMLLMTKSHHRTSSYDGGQGQARLAGGAVDAEDDSNGVGLDGSVSDFLVPSRGDWVERERAGSLDDSGLSDVASLGTVDASPTVPKSKFLTTSSMIKLFGAGMKPPSEGARVIYVAGAFDMLNAGHVDRLREAQSLGDYLIVGVHNDALANEYGGLNLPIMNMQERVLSLLGCKYVDDVLIDAPAEVTEEMINQLGIKLVLATELDVLRSENGFKVPQSLGIFQLIDDSALSVEDIISRISKQRNRLEKRFRKKANAEKSFFVQKHATTPTELEGVSDRPVLMNARGTGKQKLRK